MFKRSIFIAFLAMFLTGCAELNQAIETMESTIQDMQSNSENIEIDTLLIITDSSFNMKSIDKSKERKLDVIKERLSDLSAQLDNQKTGLGLITINGEFNKPTLQLKPNNTDFSALRTIINQQKPKNSYLPLSKALELTSDELSKAQKNVKLLLITAGDENCNGNPSLKINKLKEKFQSRLEFSIIGYGISEEIEKKLKNLAQIGNGKYYSVNDNNTFSRALDKVTNSIKNNYWQNNEFNFEIDFKSGSSELNEIYTEQIFQLAQYLQVTGYTVEIQGHTDSTGNAKANQIISQKRAQAVVNKLQDLGVTTKIYAKGYGESIPLFSNETKEGQAKNRRVTAYIIKPGYIKKKTDHKKTMKKIVNKASFKNDNSILDLFGEPENTSVEKTKKKEHVVKPKKARSQEQSTVEDLF